MFPFAETSAGLQRWDAVPTSLGPRLNQSKLLVLFYRCENEHGTSTTVGHLEIQKSKSYMVVSQYKGTPI